MKDLSYLKTRILEKVEEEVIDELENLVDRINLHIDIREFDIEDRFQNAINESIGDYISECIDETIDIVIDNLFN